MTVTGINHLPLCAVCGGQAGPAGYRVTIEYRVDMSSPPHRQDHRNTGPVCLGCMNRKTALQLLLGVTASGESANV